MQAGNAHGQQRSHPGGTFWNRRDFELPVAEVELDPARAEASESEAAQVCALVGSEDQPVG